MTGSGIQRHSGSGIQSSEQSVQSNQTFRLQSSDNQSSEQSHFRHSEAGSRGDWSREGGGSGQEERSRGGWSHGAADERGAGERNLPWGREEADHRGGSWSASRLQATGTAQKKSRAAHGGSCSSSRDFFLRSRLLSPCLLFPRPRTLLLWPKKCARSPLRCLGRFGAAETLCPPRGLPTPLGPAGPLRLAPRWPRNVAFLNTDCNVHINLHTLYFLFLRPHLLISFHVFCSTRVQNARAENVWT